jgi:hypothetical protein
MPRSSATRFHCPACARAIREAKSTSELDIEDRGTTGATRNAQTVVIPIMQGTHPDKCSSEAFLVPRSQPLATYGGEVASTRPWQPSQVSTFPSRASALLARWSLQGRRRLTIGAGSATRTWSVISSAPTRPGSLKAGN